MKFSIIQVHFIQRVAGQPLASHRDVFVQSDDFQEAVNLANQHLNGSPESVSGDGWICTNVEGPFCEEVIAVRPVESKAEAGVTECTFCRAAWRTGEPERHWVNCGRPRPSPAANTEGLREAAVWVQHLLHGQSKDGTDHISDDEWKEAISDLDAALRGEGK